MLNVDLKDVPDECPICHHHVYPIYIATAAKYPLTLREIQVAYRCARDECQSVFIAYCTGTRTTDQSISNPEPYVLRRTAPAVPVMQRFSNEIKQLSPTFVEVYNQALAAEASRLDELTGIGLRKALEFLIKDFAAYLHPGDVESIQKAPLAACIMKYIKDENLKECAKRATWLGNDETHYVRKWESKSIADLKLLVRLTVNWTENIILTKKYVDEMPGQT